MKTLWFPSPWRHIDNKWEPPISAYLCLEEFFQGTFHQDMGVHVHNIPGLLAGTVTIPGWLNPTKDQSQ